MKVPSTGYVSGFGQGAQPERRRSDDRQRDVATEGETGEESGDSAEFLGIPEDELTPRVQQAINRLLDRVNALRGELNDTRQRVGALEQLADSDALLPVFNRRALMREFARLIALTRRHNLSLSVMYIDVNGLKAINDTYGHTGGDAALRAVADALIASSRDSDIIGRMGGDEFALLLPHETGVTASGLGARWAARIADIPLELDKQNVPVSISYGVHQLTAEDDVQSAIEAADRAMYRHKRELESGGEAAAPD